MATKNRIPSLQDHVLDAIVDAARDAGFHTTSEMSASNVGALFFHAIKPGKRAADGESASTGTPAIKATLTLGFNFQTGALQLTLAETDARRKQIQSWYLHTATQSDKIEDAIARVAFELEQRAPKAK
jgi:hypothetical protein